MKTTKLLFLVLSVIFCFTHCNDENSLSSDKNISNSEKLFKIHEPTINGVFFGDWVTLNDINYLYAYGWKGIDLTEEDNNANANYEERWEEANGAGYYFKFAQIWRPYLSENPNTKNIQQVKHIIDLASADGAKYIFIDDFLTTWVTNDGDTTSQIPDPADTNRILKATIDEICDYAHNKSPRIDVAVSDECSNVYKIGHIWNDYAMPLYEKIDIIVPYGYDTTPGSPNYVSLNDLTNFYMDIKDPSKGLNKKVIAMLGYKVPMHEVSCSQLGSMSGAEGFIERALLYTEESLIFYYCDNNRNYLYQLTDYLQTWGYITGTPVP